LNQLQKKDKNWFAMKELLNPLTNQHLDIFPEDAEGKDVYKLSQSRRWLEELSPTKQVQMCTSNQKHCYIFEPVQLQLSSTIVIPIFFYKIKTQLF
jgi:hypothetical protein